MAEDEFTFQLLDWTSPTRTVHVEFEFPTLAHQQVSVDPEMMIPPRADDPDPRAISHRAKDEKIVDAPRRVETRFTIHAGTDEEMEAGIKEHGARLLAHLGNVSHAEEVKKALQERMNADAKEQHEAAVAARQSARKKHVKKMQADTEP